MKNRILLVLVVALAFFLRFWQLGTNPPSLTWDEVAWGYNAYSLGETGKDEFGRFLPFDYLESFGDFKPPVYAYLAILPVKIFGLNEFSVRFPSAFLGVLMVLLVYFLVKELFPGCSAFPLIASFLLAISPWHTMLSRAAFEANIAQFFIVAGVTFFLTGLRRQPWLLVFSAISFALSLQTFNTARIVGPLLVVLLAIAFRKSLWQSPKIVLISAIAGLIILLPAIPFWLAPQAQLRFKEVNIFSSPTVVALANQEMSNDNWAWWSRVIHNRRWGYTREYLRHYFDHFNPGFLFFKGDGNPKFSTQDVGELYLWEIPFLAAGVLLLLKRKEGHWWIVPLWLLIGIIPAATARETPHALRIETTLPTWQILSAIGVVGFWEYVNKKGFLIKNLLRVTGYGLLVISFLYFQHGYWRHYPTEYSGEWQYAYKPALEFVKNNQAKYSQIWFSEKLGRPYIYFLFYLKTPPAEFQKTAKIEREVFGFVKVRSFGKYHFFSSPEELVSSPKTLVVDWPGNVPVGGRLIQTFGLLNGREELAAYEI